MDSISIWKGSIEVEIIQIVTLGGEAYTKPKLRRRFGRLYVQLKREYSTSQDDKLSHRETGKGRTIALIAMENRFPIANAKIL